MRHYPILELLQPFSVQVRTVETMTELSKVSEAASKMQVIFSLIDHCRVSKCLKDL